MPARTKNSAVNLEITNTSDGFNVVGGNSNTGSLGVYSGSVNMIADSSATNLQYTFPSVSDVLVGATASQTLTNKTLTDPSIDGISEEPTFARVLLYDLSSQKLGYTASSAFGGGGGGGGTPGGSDTYIQYNEAGVFGGESNLTWDYTANRFSVTGSVVLNGPVTASSTIYAPNIGTGVDNSVVVLASTGFLVTDEIDSRVWGTTLVDAANGVNNRLATFTDSNSLNGESSLTFDGSTLIVNGAVSASSLTGSLNIPAGGTLGIGAQTFYPQGSDGFSVNENFNVGSSIQTAYHFTSGDSARPSVVFSLARTANFTNMFGVTGSAADNKFVFGAEFGNTDFEWRKSLGVTPVQLQGGTLLASLSRNGNFYVLGEFTGSSAQLTGLTQQNYNRVLVSDTNGNIAYTASSAFGGGGGTSPGGSDTQIQYNEGGNFGGEANLTWDYTANRLSVTGSSVLNGAVTITGLLTGSSADIATSITASTAQLTGLTTQAYSNVLVANNDGNIAITASSAFGGGGLSTRTGVYRTFYIPATSGEYNENGWVNEYTASNAGFKSRYWEVADPSGGSSGSMYYTFGMPSAWNSATAIKVFLHCFAGNDATNPNTSSIWVIGSTSVDEGERISNMPAPAYADHLLIHSDGTTAHTALTKAVNNTNPSITISGSPTTSSLIVLSVERRNDPLGESITTTDTYDQPILFLGFEVQYQESETEPSSI